MESENAAIRSARHHPPHCAFSLILALQLGGTTYPWSNERVIALLVVSGALFISFVGIQAVFPALRSFSPDLTLNRNVVLAADYSGSISGRMFVIITHLPVWFQSVEDASALRSGVMMTPLILSFMVLSIVSGGVTQAIGFYNPAMIFGGILATISITIIGMVTPNISSSKWIGYQILYGLGAGAGVPRPMLVIQTVLPADQIPIGVALVNLTQMLWSAVAVAIAQSLFVDKLGKGISAVTPALGASGIAKTGATHLYLTYGREHLHEVLPIYNDALIRTFYLTAALSAGAFFLATGLQWKTMEKKASKRMQITTV